MKDTKLLTVTFFIHTFLEIDLDRFEISQAEPVLE